MSSLKINLVKYPTESDWLLVKDIALITINKKAVNPPDNDWKKAILNARHSPIRELRFIFKIENVPSYIATHYARHVHAHPYIGTQRNDRQDKYDREYAPQGTPVNMYYSVNAEELMIVMNKRLCGQADEKAQEVARGMRKEVLKKCPEFERFLVPMCVYHGGICHEMNSCNKNKSRLFDYEI